MAKYYSEDFTIKQELLRSKLLSVACNFSLEEVDSFLSQETEVNGLLADLKKETEETEAKLFFRNYSYLSKSIFDLLKWASKAFNGESGADGSLQAAKISIDLFDLNAYNYDTAFKSDFEKLREKFRALTDIRNLSITLKAYSESSFPFLFMLPKNLSVDNRSIPNNDRKKKEQVVILSISFTIGNEPWANPQILKPKEIYTIKGNVKINKWPKGFDRLTLTPVSMQNSDLYTVELQEIEKSEGDNIDIIGYVAFKYPQHSFEDSMAIKLMPTFTNSKFEKSYPTVIGYNQLVAKVLDPNSNHFFTGFSNMNSAVFSIATAILSDTPGIDNEQLLNFLALLSGVLNYQGFCLQHGVYKLDSTIKEEKFRDNLIQHLVGIPTLGENIIKEAHLAGGRVEISFKGITCELKVEKKISNRQEMIAKYSNQAVAYASGNIQQLSILCILDLTEKAFPPASPLNNIITVDPKVHGFEGVMSYPSKQIVVIIDGNIKRPSDYSK